MSKREAQERSLKNRLTKFLPNLREQYEESLELVEQLQMDERVILSNLTVQLHTYQQLQQQPKQLFGFM
jgi:hypothetical protein